MLSKATKIHGPHSARAASTAAKVATPFLFPCQDTASGWTAASARMARPRRNVRGSASKRSREEPFPLKEGRTVGPEWETSFPISSSPMPLWIWQPDPAFSSDRRCRLSLFSVTLVSGRPSGIYHPWGFIFRVKVCCFVQHGSSLPAKKQIARTELTGTIVKHNNLSRFPTPPTPACEAR